MLSGTDGQGARPGARGPPRGGGGAARAHSGIAGGGVQDLALRDRGAMDSASLEAARAAPRAASNAAARAAADAASRHAGRSP